MANGFLVDQECQYPQQLFIKLLADYKQAFLDQGYSKSYYHSVKVNRSMGDPLLTVVFWDIRDDANTYIGKSTQNIDYSAYERCDLTSSTSQPSDPSQTQNYDYAQAAEYWHVGFLIPVAVWIISHKWGVIWNFLRQWKP